MRIAIRAEALTASLRRCGVTVAVVALGAIVALQAPAAAEEMIYPWGKPPKIGPCDWPVDLQFTDPNATRLCDLIRLPAGSRISYKWYYDIDPERCDGYGARQLSGAEVEIQGEGIEVATVVSGLRPGTKYDYCVAVYDYSEPAVNGLVGAEGFVDTHGPEEPVTEACGSPPIGGAYTVCGTVNPNSNGETLYYFAYNAGSQCTGGSRTPPQAVDGYAVKVGAALSGLRPSTEYAYCLVAQAEGYVASGPTLTFTPAPAPNLPPPKGKSGLEATRVTPPAAPPGGSAVIAGWPKPLSPLGAPGSARSADRRARRSSRPGRAHGGLRRRHGRSGRRGSRRLGKRHSDRL